MRELVLLKETDQPTPRFRAEDCEVADRQRNLDRRYGLEPRFRPQADAALASLLFAEG